MLAQEYLPRNLAKKPDVQNDVVEGVLVKNATVRTFPAAPL